MTPGEIDEATKTGAMGPMPIPVIAAEGPVVILACSAGGFVPLRQILTALPVDFPAPIIVAQHRGDSDASGLVKLLAHRSHLRVTKAQAHEHLRGGWVYVCPGASHAELCSARELHCWRGERINFVRPCFDLLFRSAADCLAARAVCVVLSGFGRDGALATRHIRRAGGFVIAQDQASSEFGELPASAVDLGMVDLVLPLTDIPFALMRVCAGGAAASDSASPANSAAEASAN